MTMKALALSAIAGCVALGTPVLALADTTAVSPPSDAAKTTLVCRAPSAPDQPNALYGNVALLCTSAKQSVAISARPVQKAFVQQRDDQSWVYDIFMLDHFNGGGGDGGG